MIKPISDKDLEERIKTKKIRCSHLSTNEVIEGARDCDYIRHCVTAYLFSKDPDIKKGGLEDLKSYLSPSAQIVAIQGEGMIYSYIFLNPSDDFIWYAGKFREVDSGRDTVSKKNLPKIRATKLV